MEATRFYGWHLALYLTKAPELQLFAPEVYLFNARTIDACKRTYPDLLKTGWLDAFVLADRVRMLPGAGLPLSDPLGAAGRELILALWSLRLSPRKPSRIHTRASVPTPRP
ncbi:MAG: hypothetical protein AB1609_13550 [Bacillota bacterium]